MEGVIKHSSLYNHEIIISPYELVEDFDEPMELLAVLMETFQSDKIHSGMGPEDSPDRSMYIGTINDEDSFTDHYFFLSYNKHAGRQELFRISEEDTLAASNFVEEFYYDFLDEGCMSLYNGMVIIDTPWINSYVFSLEQGAESVFLSATRITAGVVSARVYDEEMQMLTEFSYERKYSDEIPYWHIEDLNQDGYSDIGIAFRNEEWEGKNYLAQITSDYARKENVGLLLMAFKDGQISDIVSLEQAIANNENAHQVKVDYLAEEIYRETLGNTIFDFQGGYNIEDIPRGTAEYVQNEGYSFELESDIDNDGVKELYDKSVFIPSNRYYVAGLNMIFDEENEGELLEKTINEEGNPLFLWVDETQRGNVTYVLYEDNRYDFHICAYLLTEEKCELLMRVNHTFDIDVNVIKDVDSSEFVNG